MLCYFIFETCRFVMWLLNADAWWLWSLRTLWIAGWTRRARFEHRLGQGKGPIAYTRVACISIWIVQLTFLGLCPSMEKNATMPFQDLCDELPWSSIDAKTSRTENSSKYSLNGDSPPRQRTPRESPALATYSLLPCLYTTEAVQPA